MFHSRTHQGGIPSIPARSLAFAIIALATKHPHLLHGVVQEDRDERF